MISVTKELRFEAAHKLEQGYEGKCKVMHGHNYKIFVTMALFITQTELDSVAMIMDFSEIKKLWKEELEPLVDHQTLNDVFGFQSTAENLSIFLFQEFTYHLYKKYGAQQPAMITKIKVYENDDSYAEYTPYNYVDVGHMAVDPMTLQSMIKVQNRGLSKGLEKNMNKKLKAIYENREVEMAEAKVKYEAEVAKVKAEEDAKADKSVADIRAETEAKKLNN